MLHIHGLLVAPLGARHMAQPRTDQHQGGVPVGERPHHAGPAADLTVQSLDYVVGADGRCGADERGLAMVSVYSLWKADHHTGQPRRGQDLLRHASCGGLYQPKAFARYGDT